MLRHDPDVILVQETLLGSCIRVAIPNFFCYRDDKVPKSQSNPLPKHGTAVFIKNSIPHHRIPTPGLRVIEATTICINETNVSPLTIASVYVRNNPHPSFTEDIDLISKLNPSTVLCGDFNAKHKRWHSGNGNTAGTILHDFAELAGFEIIAPPTPTRYGRNSQSTIDLTLHKGFSFHCNIESIPDLGSDHNPVICTFDISLKMPEVGVYFTTNWEIPK